MAYRITYDNGRAIDAAGETLAAVLAEVRSAIKAGRYQVATLTIVTKGTSDQIIPWDEVKRLTQL